jgi:NADH-quinone oxidoreductase subunit G/NADP-reducing hydrogenase subunit HndD
MTFEIEINNKTVKVNRGETILEVLNRTGIKVPTLCSMKDFLPTGMCRLCVVELEGKEKLIPSCSFKVEEWMKIKTHSPRVILARKTIIELLLANHPDDCLYCERNGNCELQTFAEDMHVRERRIVGAKNSTCVDKSNIAIIHEPSKCILCGRCIRVCNEKMGVSTFDFSHRGVRTSVTSALEKPINSSSCVFCGQCVMICPTAALSERVNFSEMQVYFHDPSKKMAVFYSPVVAATIAEVFDFKLNRNINSIIQSILKKVGFEIIFDTSTGTDMMIMEMCGDFLNRLKNNGPFPMFTSSCPSWVKFIEQSYPQFIKNLCTAKSYHQLSGILAKHVIAKQKSLLPEDIYLVSIGPCTSRKFEASRPEMTALGISDVDSVITTREFLRMIKMYGIDVNGIVSETDNSPYSSAGITGKTVSITGGTTEIFLKTLSFLLTRDDSYRTISVPKMINKPYKEFHVTIGDQTLGIAIVNGLGNVKTLLDEIKLGRSDIHFVEVMSCPNGCIGGGGQPMPFYDDSVKKRIKYLLDWIEMEPLNLSEQNLQLKKLYEKYFSIPMPSNYFDRFHTNFIKRDVFI